MVIGEVERVKLEVRHFDTVLVLEMALFLRLRDRPFLFLGIQAEWIYKNRQKNFMPHENTIKIFRTPSKSG